MGTLLRLGGNSIRRSVLSLPWVANIFITGCNTGPCIAACIIKANIKLDRVALLVTDPHWD